MTVAVSYIYMGTYFYIHECGIYYNYVPASLFLYNIIMSNSHYLVVCCNYLLCESVKGLCCIVIYTHYHGVNFTIFCTVHVGLVRCLVLYM